MLACRFPASLLSSAMGLAPKSHGLIRHSCVTLRHRGHLCKYLQALLNFSRAVKEKTKVRIKVKTQTSIVIFTPLIFNLKILKFNTHVEMNFFFQISLRMYYIGASICCSEVQSTP